MHSRERRISRARVALIACRAARAERRRVGAAWSCSFAAFAPPIVVWVRAGAAATRWRAGLQDDARRSTRPAGAGASLSPSPRPAQNRKLRSERETRAQNCSYLCVRLRQRVCVSEDHLADASQRSGRGPHLSSLVRRAITREPCRGEASPSRAARTGPPRGAPSRSGRRTSRRTSR